MKKKAGKRTRVNASCNSHEYILDALSRQRRCLQKQNFRLLSHP